MSATVDHNFGATNNNATPLLAIPISPGGFVNITILDNNDKVVGKTTSNKRGQWNDSFLLSGGTYQVKFTGNFLPIGSSVYSRFYQPTTSQTISIVVPKESVSTTEPAGPSGPQGKKVIEEI